MVSAVNEGTWAFEKVAVLYKNFINKDGFETHRMEMKKPRCKARLFETTAGCCIPIT
jgi:hypothetical protein